ncbi:uncharacterized protein LOC103723376 [Phoenix dactylifera]|uniref:Uncharacterized protein LOC103723376 n=1 Tax=Phoenix dactylifera TaxID=42345 RepID=A0A8B7D3T6_PHODC|nr:uncharacterized protein LOC103723376 [Phoenix dactylifera]
MAPPSLGLVGPPEIHLAAAAVKPDACTSEPFLDIMDAGFNAAAPALAPMGRTENFSPTFLSSGNPCLDFFFQVVADTPAGTLTSLLAAAWARDPLTALKLACHLRGVRGTGKSDREGFYSAALWLHRHHPKTLALNLLRIAVFGYLKDLPEILHRLVDGDDTRQRAKANHRLSRPNLRWARCRPTANRDRLREGTREERLAGEAARVKIEKEKAEELRRKKRSEMAVRAVQRYERDPEYRFLHDSVADVFAELLRTDLGHLNSGEFDELSLAAKWCPSLDSSYDRSTLLCEAIARRLFPRDSEPEYAALENRHYAYRVRDRLRRAALVPLRGALELPEVYMSAGRWDSLPYNRVASVAMKNYKKLFTKHDAARFSEYLENVRRGTAKVAAGALLPHEIISDAGDEVAELQWKRMVEDLSKKGSLRNCIAVCDVSGSMHGAPMEVSVALGLLISELSEEPWKGRVITFSADPEMHRIGGDSLEEKTLFIRTMQWGMNTDFQKVFDKMLAVAVEGRLPAEKMVRRVFVFSDMEFDMASANDWETDYEAIRRKFGESGYGEAVPEVVFWNLRDSRSTPVPSVQKGVALVSGFSKNLLKLFLEGDGVLIPEAVMEEAISGEEYKKLVVFD